MAKRISTRITVDGTPLCQVGTVADKLRLGALRKCKFDTRKEGQTRVEELREHPFFAGCDVQLVEHPGDLAHRICPGCMQHHAELRERHEAEEDPNSPRRPLDSGSWTVRRWHDNRVDRDHGHGLRFGLSTPGDKLGNEFWKILKETHISEIDDDLFKGFIDRANALIDETLREIPETLRVDASDDDNATRATLKGVASTLLKDARRVHEMFVQEKAYFDTADLLTVPLKVTVQKRFHGEPLSAWIHWIVEPDKFGKYDQHWNRKQVMLDAIQWDPSNGDSDEDLVEEIRSRLDRELFVSEGVEIEVLTGRGGNVGFLTIPPKDDDEGEDDAS